MVVELLFIAPVVEMYTVRASSSRDIGELLEDADELDGRARMNTLIESSIILYFTIYLIQTNLTQH